MRPAAAAEEAGLPSVVIANTGFINSAHLVGKSWGIDDLRIAEYPGAVAIHSAEVIAKNIEEVLLDRVIDGLTKSPQTKAPGTAGGAKPGKVVLTGTFDEVNRFFRQQEWTDGLPIVPPTVEAVEAFLAHTDRGADDELAILPPAKLKATPRNVAVNAIMAGCEPRHMPLLIAAAEALGDESYNLNSFGSTSGILPYLLVNGPIVRQLGIECTGPLVSGGPNPALGRALGLIVRNIAGFRPGKNYLGSFGYPMVFALAENEEASPWEAFHVEHGFSRETSTVTLGATNVWSNAPAPGSAPDKSGGEITLEVLCKELAKRVRVYCLPRETVMITVLMTPPVARSLAEAGYSKKRVKEYIYENARMPRRDFEWAIRYTGGMQGEGSGQSAPAVGAKADEMLRLLDSPEVVHIIVCGDPNRNRVMLLEGNHAKRTTRAVELPGDWDELPGVTLR